MLIYINLVFIFISTVYGDDEEAKLRFYHTSFDDYLELPMKNATGICSIPWFDRNRSTIFVCHGFKGNATGPAVKAMSEPYINRQDCNVVLINWEELAADKYNDIALSYLLSGVPNALQLGSDFADSLISLKEACLDINKTHILGHSLCAHSMGITGNKMVDKGVKLPWITGLDPAGNIFNLKLPQTTLNSKSADFVDVFHCDYFEYGSIRSMGKVDFWPNYPENQPGCSRNLTYEPFSPEDLCNHNRCCQFLADIQSERPEKLLGCYARNYITWKNYRKEERNITLEMGKFDLQAKPGDYFLTTNDMSPYGRGVDGLKPT